MPRTSRRQWLNTAAGASLGAIAIPSNASAHGSNPETQGAPAAPPAQAAAPTPRSKDTVSVSKRGQYEKVALRSDFVNVAAIQSRIRAVDGNNPGPGLKEGLEHAINSTKRLLQPYGPQKAGITGHLRADNIVSIYAISLKQGKTHLRGLNFYDAKGDSQFSIFLPREGAPVPKETEAAFDKTWAMVAALPRVCK